MFLISIKNIRSQRVGFFFFLIKSGLMLLQAGGSLLGPEKYDSTPQRCKEAQEQRRIPASLISQASSPQLFVSFYLIPAPLPLNSIPHFPPLFGSGFPCPFSFLKVCHLDFSSSPSQQLAPKIIRWRRARDLRGGQR